jgi:Zn-dependent protease with chaperone function
MLEHVFARAYPLVLAAMLGACAAPGAPQRAVHYWDVAAIPSGSVAIVELSTGGVQGEPYAISVQRAQIEQLRRMTQKLSSDAGLPMPRLFLSDDMQWTGVAGKDHDGKPAIAVTVRLLHVADGDEGVLAATIGHELGHIALQHVAARSLDATQTDVTRFSYRQELEADEYGTRLAKKSGYDLGGLERFFEKMRVANPRLVYLDGYHPPQEERIANIRRIARELEAR